MVEALPAVTVPPSRLNAGLSFASAAAVFSARGPSSCATFSGSPLRCGTSTGTISRANSPASRAATARRCDSAAKASCASRVIPCFSTTSSAVIPMW